MDKNKSLIQLVKRQIQVEKTNVMEAAEKGKRTGSTVTKLLLNVIRSDSKKHADILRGTLKLLRGTPRSETSWDHMIDAYIGPVLARRELEAHLEREAQMIALVKEEMKHTKDEGIRFLFQHILDDEKRHHKILQVIQKHLYKLEE